MLSALLASVVVVGSVAVSPQDSDGRFSVEYSAPALEIYRADGYKEWDHWAQLPGGWICEVRTFVGWDRGSIGEANLELNFPGGYRLMERSEHKELMQNYDAWKTAHTRRAVQSGEWLNMHLGAAQTAPNATDAGLSTRVHMTYRLMMSLTAGGCQ